MDGREVPLYSVALAVFLWGCVLAASAGIFGVSVLLGFPWLVAGIFALYPLVGFGILRWVTPRLGAAFGVSVHRWWERSMRESSVGRWLWLVSLGGFCGLYGTASPSFLRGVWWSLAWGGLFFWGILQGAWWICFRIEEGEDKGTRVVWSRWLRRYLTAWCALVMTGILVFVGLFGGLRWWHQTYVTSALSREVRQRYRELSSRRLVYVYDDKGVYQGLVRRTRSDWSKAYDDPRLLSWPVTRAILASEGDIDHFGWYWNFMPHAGGLNCKAFSFRSLLRVPYYYITRGRKIGGSPPSLQAAKNWMDFGAHRKGLGLKELLRVKATRELPRAYAICEQFEAREVMAAYFSTLWIGRGDQYGLHRMALYFFDQLDLSMLSWNQAVVLAAALPNPARMNPWFLRQCVPGISLSRTQRRYCRLWKGRIRTLKKKLRAQGISIARGMPRFRNGLWRLRPVRQRSASYVRSRRAWDQGLAPRLCSPREQRQVSSRRAGALVASQVDVGVQ